MQSEAEVKAHIAMKAAEDDDFRARLVADPRAALEEEIGLRFPDGYRLHVHRSRPPTPTWCSRRSSSSARNSSTVSLVARIAATTIISAFGDPSAASKNRHPDHKQSRWIRIPDAPSIPVNRRRADRYRFAATGSHRGWHVGSPHAGGVGRYARRREGVARRQCGLPAHHGRDGARGHRAAVGACDSQCRARRRTLPASISTASAIAPSVGSAGTGVRSAMMENWSALELGFPAAS